jgi:hypothetical protein
VERNKMQNLSWSSFAHPTTSFFHNHMVGPSLGFHKTLVGDILYYIADHPTSSTKNRNKCMSIWLTRLACVGILLVTNFWSAGCQNTQC